jgi:hypothetical protein
MPDKYGLLLAVVVAVLVSAPAFAQTTSGPAPAVQTPSAQNLKDWRSGMQQVPVPKQGCFTSSYPSTTWQEVPCTTAPARPYLPVRGPRSQGQQTAGANNDALAAVGSHISTAVGSFDSVTGVTSETGTDPDNGNPNTPNIFSLQLNSNFFSTSTCSGAANPANCLGWEQFVYSSTDAQAFIQYWLISYDATCPTNWMPSGNDCYRNSSGVSTSTVTIANLINLSVVAEATASTDMMIFSNGTTLYALQASDSVVNLAQGWQQSEFNIFGDGNGTEANFNNGSALVVRISVDYGNPSAPSCVNGGTTAETNNLSFASAPVAERGSSPAIMFTESSSGVAASPCAGTTTIASGAVIDSHDFNADGHSDIFWRDTSGNMAIWEMSSGTVLNPSGSGLGGVATTWSIVGQRDFNGDGIADILWHDTSGNLAIWEMDGTKILNPSSAGLGAISTAWSVAGVGDFNGDGFADILWRDTSTGAVAIWEMNGTTVLNPSSSGVGTVAANWSVVGVGDFNGDGKADILWQNTTNGNLAIYLMNGTTVTSSATFANLGAYTVVGTGDFNGDGKSDILLRDGSGDIAIWEMNGTTILNPSAAGVGNLSTVWSVAVTGDFNGDGKSDILWRDTSGDTAIWFMNGTAMSSGAGLGTISTTFTVQGTNAD